MLNAKPNEKKSRSFGAPFSGTELDRVAFPLGGMGSGMICMEGAGCISHVSVHNKPDVYNEPDMFAALSIKDSPCGPKILQGPVPDWKIFGAPGSGKGGLIGPEKPIANGYYNYGLPRMEAAKFHAEFPFCEIDLEHSKFPVAVSIKAWSPFCPSDEEASSLPVAGLEYSFRNLGDTKKEAVFSFHAPNFMRRGSGVTWAPRADATDSVRTLSNGFILSESGAVNQPHTQGEFAVCTDHPGVFINGQFRGGWFDARTAIWRDVETQEITPFPTGSNASGASMYIPIALEPGEETTIRLMLAWYVPCSDVFHSDPYSTEYAEKESFLTGCRSGSSCSSEDFESRFYKPWYSERFSGIDEVSSFWSENYERLRQDSRTFSNAFFSQSLPAEVIEAVAANLSILKSPTVLRTRDGKLWGWEGSSDQEGCCPGSCTHVWNYAQSIPNLFPRLERTLRDVEFTKNQDDNGHQGFRSNLPVSSHEPASHDMHAACDGQLGGIIKFYREWRISGNDDWLCANWSQIARSIAYCVRTWDPEHRGMIVEPHHNTYDVEFWGPNGMTTSIYVAALAAYIEMGEKINEDIDGYKELYARGLRALENDLYNGEYFIQRVQWTDLKSDNPIILAERGEERNVAATTRYSDEAIRVLNKEGPKYQYGIGCLADGIIGDWFARVAGLETQISPTKVRSHLRAVFANNFKRTLSNHANTQRPSYAVGDDAGLVLCSWPNGGKPLLPFVYCDEVWTGIEYQVASHLMMLGDVDLGLQIVRAVRRRYDGSRRNPFGEYECGHWYARAMSSYALIYGMSGTMFDARNNTLVINPETDQDFSSFLAIEGGFGLVGLRGGEPFIDVRWGKIEPSQVIVFGEERTDWNQIDD